MIKKKWTKKRSYKRRTGRRVRPHRQRYGVRRKNQCPECGCPIEWHGINRLPNGNYILHCDKSCGACWTTETSDKKALSRQFRQRYNYGAFDLERTPDTGLSSYEKIIELPIEQVKIMRGRYNLPRRATVLKGLGKRDIEEIPKLIKEQYKDTIKKEYGHPSEEEIVRFKTEEKVKELEEQGFKVKPWKMKWKGEKERGGFPYVHLEWRGSQKQFKDDIAKEMQPYHSSDKLFDFAETRDESEEYLSKMTEALKSPKPKVEAIRVSKKEMEKGVFGEGRHRILAAEKAGMSKIPLIIDSRE